MDDRTKYEKIKGCQRRYNMTRKRFIWTTLAALPFVGKLFKRKSHHDELKELIEGMFEEMQ